MLRPQLAPGVKRLGDAHCPNLDKAPSPTRVTFPNAHMECGLSTAQPTDLDSSVDGTRCRELGVSEGVRDQRCSNEIGRAVSFKSNAEVDRPAADHSRR